MKSIFTYTMKNTSSSSKKRTFSLTYKTDWSNLTFFEKQNNTHISTRRALCHMKSKICLSRREYSLENLIEETKRLISHESTSLFVFKLKNYSLYLPLNTTSSIDNAIWSTRMTRPMINLLKRKNRRWWRRRRNQRTRRCRFFCLWHLCKWPFVVSITHIIKKRNTMRTDSSPSINIQFWSIITDEEEKRKCSCVNIEEMQMHIFDNLTKRKRLHKMNLISSRSMNCASFTLISRPQNVN